MLLLFGSFTRNANETVATLYIIMSFTSLFVTLLMINLLSSIMISQIASVNANLYDPIPKDPFEVAKQTQDSIFSFIPPHLDAKINSSKSIMHVCNLNNKTNDNCIITPAIHQNLKSKSNNSIINFKNGAVGTLLRNSISSGNNPQRDSTASDLGLDRGIPKGISPPVNLLTKCDNEGSFRTNNHINNNNNLFRGVPSLALTSNSIMSMATSSNQTNNSTLTGNNSQNTTSPNTTSPNTTTCVITGSYGPDIIIGPSRNTIALSSANPGSSTGDKEILRGVAGNDIILCGSGSSCTVTTGPGDSILRSGGATEAKLYGGIGDNVFIGGDGDSLMVGNLGNEQFYAGTGHDTMIGGPGRNYFDCGLSGNAVVLNYNPLLDTKAGNCKYIVYQKAPVPPLP